MSLPPSTFIDFPWNSTAQKSEKEVVAQNIMIISKRLGDKWGLTLKQYRTEREKDGEYSASEEDYAKEMLQLLEGPIDCISFSKTWAAAAKAAVSKA